MLFSLLLLGCSEESFNSADKAAKKVEKPISKKFAVLNIDISTATRDSIANDFSTEGLVFVRKINKWEEVWSIGSLFKDAKQIKLGFTESENLAYFQYNFDHNEEINQTSIVQATAEKMFGKPSNISGTTDSGEYEAVWEMDDGLTVSVTRDWPSKQTNLTYYNDKQYDVLKLEYKIEASKLRDLVK